MELNELQALDIWRRAIVSSVRLDAPDLSARQMALLLTVYLTPPPHTVRGMAELRRKRGASARGRNPPRPRRSREGFLREKFY